MDIKTLIAVATGKIPHNYRSGLCPDELQPDSRDPDCPACKILTEAEARVADLEADRAEREAGKLLAYLSNDRTQFFIPSMEGKDVKHAPYMAHWMAGWTPLYSAPPVAAPVRLTDLQVIDLFHAWNDTAGSSHADLIRSVETAALVANGFDIQPARGEG